MTAIDRAAEHTLDLSCTVAEHAAVSHLATLLDITEPVLIHRPRSLPVVALWRHETPSSLSYVISAADDRGRIANRSLIRHAGLHPGQPIKLSIVRGVIVVRAARERGESVTKQGWLRLPASIRHSCHVRPGDRLLVAASPELATLVVCHTSLIDAALVNLFTSEYGGMSR